jgi:hypothetical protein
MLPLQMFWTTWPLPVIYVSVLRGICVGCPRDPAGGDVPARSSDMGPRHWSSERFEPRALGVRRTNEAVASAFLILHTIPDRDGMHAAVGQPQLLHRSCQKMPEW